MVRVAISLSCTALLLLINLTPEQALGTSVYSIRNGGLHSSAPVRGRLGSQGTITGCAIKTHGRRNHSALAFVARRADVASTTGNKSTRRPYRESLISAASRSKAPDLSSTLLSERTIFIGLPIQTAVAQLVITQLLYLDNDAQKPIKIYINCADDAVSEDPRSSSDIDALNIVDVMRYVKSEIITVNLGKAYGPAALILAAGAHGKRFVLPRSFTALRQPSASLELMQAEDISIYSKEILKGRKQVVAALAKFCGKTEEEVLETINRSRYLDAQQAVDYGLADKLLSDCDI